jgi:hypothetical protein
MPSTETEELKTTSHLLTIYKKKSMCHIGNMEDTSSPKILTKQKSKVKVRPTRLTK